MLTVYVWFVTLAISVY